jgi:Holliday junction DNA helicase RuvB
LNATVEEFLYSAMEDYKIDLIIDKGPGARSIQLNLNPFTLIGATTRAGLLSSPLRARFGINMHLEYYDASVLERIVERSAKLLNVRITKNAAKEIASRSRGTPRIANSLLRRVRDFSQVRKMKEINMEITEYALEALNIDKNGLDDMDNRILLSIVEKFDGGPVGISTIATAVSEDAGTIEEVYEPFLIKEGYLKRTPRGREVTPLTYKHFGKDKTGNLALQFD